MGEIETGCRTEVTYEKIEQLFRDLDLPVLTAKDVEEEFDSSNQAANYRLSKMVEQGTIEKRKVGGAAAVYWLRET